MQALRVRMRFMPLFYGPLAVLHGSLFVRLSPGAFHAALRHWGGLLNVAALVLFAGTLTYAVMRSATAVSAETRRAHR